MKSISPHSYLRLYRAYKRTLYFSKCLGLFICILFQRQKGIKLVKNFQHQVKKDYSAIHFPSIQIEKPKIRFSTFISQKSTTKQTTYPNIFLKTKAAKDPKYIPSKSVRELRAEMIREVFRQTLTVQLSPSDAFTLSVYPEISAICKLYLEFIGLSTKPTFHQQDYDQMQFFAPNFIEVVKIRTKMKNHFPVQSGSLRKQFSLYKKLFKSFEKESFSWKHFLRIHSFIQNKFPTINISQFKEQRHEHQLSLFEASYERDCKRLARQKELSQIELIFNLEIEILSSTKQLHNSLNRRDQKKSKDLLYTSFRDFHKKIISLDQIECPLNSLHKISWKIPKNTPQVLAQKLKWK